MAISFQCPNCRRRLRVKDDFAGKRTKCPACEVRLKVPILAPPAPAEGGQRTPQPAERAPTTFTSEALQQELLRIHGDYRAAISELTNTTVRGCVTILFGIVVFPIGIVLLSRFRKKWREKVNVSRTALDSLAQTNDVLFEEAMAVEELRTDADFLRLISKERYEAHRKQEIAEEKERRARFDEVCEQEYGQIGLEIFLRDDFYMPQICATCGQSAEPAGGYTGAIVHNVVVQTDALDALHFRTTSVNLPSCLACYSDEPAIEGFPRPKPEPSAWSGVGPLHNDFIAEFYRENDIHPVTVTCSVCGKESRREYLTSRCPECDHQEEASQSESMNVAAAKLKTGKSYLRKGMEKTSIIFLEQAIEAAPDSESADEARALLRKLDS